MNSSIRTDGLRFACLAAAGAALLLSNACHGSAGGSADGPSTTSARSGDAGEGTGPGEGAETSVPDAATCAPPAASPPDDCAARLEPGADRKCTLEFGGVSREVLVYAPPSYDPCKPAPLVVDAHGTSETDAEQAGKEPFRDWPGGLGSGWRLVADREGFLVAQPQGLGNVWNPADADFMVQIPALVGRMADVDPARVYMTGISNGGELTYWTGCKDTDVFRALASVSGFGQLACPLTHHAPAIAFHSPDDKVIPFAQGQAAFQAWVQSNHCARGPVDSWQFGGTNGDPREVCLRSESGTPPTWKLSACDPSAPATTCQSWDQCDGDITAIFCTVPADKQNHYDTTGGHVLYVNATNLSLAAVAWEFFGKGR